MPTIKKKEEKPYLIKDEKGIKKVRPGDLNYKSKVRTSFKRKPKKQKRVYYNNTYEENK